MKVKVIARSVDEFTRERSQDLQRVLQNYDPSLRPQEKAVEYVRAVNAVKLDKIFARPFIGALDGHIDAISCMAKNPSQLKGIFSGSMNGDIRLWDLASRDSVDTKFETIEARLTSMLPQLQSECGILQRIVYKNKNQHRRSSYFQRLLKLRRDLRLLQSANLEELVTSCLHVIKGDKPRQKVILLESLKRRKCDGEKHNFMERLLGAARLLVEMVEPILKAASEVSVLFAQSFFMGFSLTIMALLARLRVLVQQILLDVVSLFNMVSSLSITKQSTKITLNGIEVFRDFYPVSDDFVTLDCVWKSDKFILHERTHKRKNENQAEGSNEHASVQTSNVNYNSIEYFLGDDDQLEGVEAVTAKEDLCHVDNMNMNNTDKMSMYREEGENQDTTKASINESSQQAALHISSKSSTNHKLHSMPNKVAFVSVKNLSLTRPPS